MFFYEFFSAVVCSVAIADLHNRSNSTEGDCMYLNALENQLIPDLAFQLIFRAFNNRLELLLQLIMT